MEPTLYCIGDQFLHAQEFKNTCILRVLGLIYLRMAWHAHTLVLLQDRTIKLYCTCPDWQNIMFVIQKQKATELPVSDGMNLFPHHICSVYLYNYTTALCSYFFLSPGVSVIPVQYSTACSTTSKFYSVIYMHTCYMQLSFFL